MNEKLLEKKLRDGVRNLKGVALKFNSYTFTGMPDRIVLLPGGKIKFVEVKSTGKKPTPIQLKRIEMLNRMGFDARVIDSPENLSEFFKEVQNEI